MKVHVPVLCCLLALLSAPGWALLPSALNVDGVTLFPLRYIAEWFGAQVDFRKPGGRIAIRVRGRVVRLTLNKAQAAIDGHPVTLSRPAFERAGVTYVPVRFVAEALGARVDLLAALDPAAEGFVTIRDPDTGDVLLLRLPGADDVIPPPDKQAGRLLLAAGTGKTAVVREILGKSPKYLNVRDLAGETPLYKACATGSLECVNELLVRGADTTIPNLDRRTPLHAAAGGGWEKILALLIGHGARFNAKDVLGVTPLHLAARAGRADMVQTLLDYGAYVDGKDIYGQTALFDAARAGDGPTATLLLNMGADVDSHDVDRNTPLHRAAANGRESLVSLLLVCGADPKAVAKGGKTPRQLAEAKGFSEVAALLKAAEEKVKAK
ncbi:MAG: ankyrin repeat domain-containing protein [Armatimonadota bacterium]